MGKSNKQRRWESKHQQAFDDVKWLFDNHPHFYHPENESKYVLYTGASEVAVGIVLCQKNTGDEHRVTADTNTTVKGAERNCFTLKTKFELLCTPYVNFPLTYRRKNL